MSHVLAFRAHTEVRAALLAEAHRRRISVSRLLHDLVVQAIGRDAMPAEGRRAA
jgi:hypothetical protein